MSRFLIAVFIVVIGFFLQGLAPASAQSSSRLVLAFYYTWFDENTWRPDHVAEIPAEPYVSRDRAVMARHIEQAQAVGIDAFVVSWYGPHIENNQTETNFAAMLDEAAARGFRLAVDFETYSPFFGGPGDAQAALAALLATHVNHPAYLRVEGKPVIFFWRQQRFSLDTWAGIRNAVDPNRTSLWIEEGIDVTPLSVFDGHHLYNVTWNPPSDLAYTANKFAKRVRARAAQLGVPKVYVATAMPGYDDRQAGRGAAAYATGREDGAYYARSWQAAINSQPDWIVITSFNEWREGTQIEPGQSYGGKYLDLTAQWTAAFRGSAPPPVVALPTLAPAAPRPAAVTRAQPTATPAPMPTPRPALPPEEVYRTPGGISML